MMATAEPMLREWRATGPYLPTAASKNGLIAETRLFLQAYSTSHSLQQARDDLINRLLPQRSRTTRVVIARNILARLTRWHPPSWVLDDLVSASQQEDPSRLRALLLLHHARQETLLYDMVQRLIVPRWQGGELQISRDDALAFLSEAVTRQPEVGGWSYETRVKVAGNLLTTLRDYGLLSGKQIKQIVEPVVDRWTAEHLIRLLREEGIPETRLAEHTDWRLWLMLPNRIQSYLMTA
jgi:BrxA